MASTLKQILLIEDSTNDAELLKEALFSKEAAGTAEFSLEWAKNLRSGIERLEKGGIDIVIMDLGLPDGHGLMTFTTLQQAVPHVPVIILTGTYQEDAIGMEAVKQGAQDFLTKGEVDGKLLCRMMRYAIERKQSIEALKREKEKVEQMNRFMVDRENRLIELKREVNSLLTDLKQPPRYNF